MPSILSSNVNLQWRSETEIDDHLCPAFHISSHLNLIPSHLSMINFTRPTSAEDPLGISASCMRDEVSYCASRSHHLCDPLDGSSQATQEPIQGGKKVEVGR